MLDIIGESFFRFYEALMRMAMRPVRFKAEGELYDNVRTLIKRDLVGLCCFTVFLSIELLVRWLLEANTIVDWAITISLSAIVVPGWLLFLSGQQATYTLKRLNGPRKRRLWSL
jgi:hypothetical protein